MITKLPLEIAQRKKRATAILPALERREAELGKTLKTEYSFFSLPESFYVLLGESHKANNLVGECGSGDRDTQSSVNRLSKRETTDVILKQRFKSNLGATEFERD